MAVFRRHFPAIVFVLLIAALKKSAALTASPSTTVETTSWSSTPPTTSDFTSESSPTTAATTITTTAPTTTAETTSTPTFTTSVTTTALLTTNQSTTEPITSTQEPSSSTAVETTTLYPTTSSPEPSPSTAVLTTTYPITSTEMLTTTPFMETTTQIATTTVVSTMTTTQYVPETTPFRTTTVEVTTETMACASQPCHNDGTCIDGLGSYSCNCPGRYTGLHCETDINECDSSPCRNNGTCIDGINSMTCSCVPGYSGTFCETDINECNSSPCQNNATCIDEVNLFACVCVPGYSGAFCDTEIDECFSLPCQNLGTCIDQLNRYKCVCMQSTTGVNCERNLIAACVDDPCQNGARCYADTVTNTTACQCVPGFIGAQCETEINECLSNPCQHGGVCTDQVNSYVCNCVIGYTGANCETDINECSSNPCQHGGSCTDGLDLFVCNCPVGYTGVKCETNIDDCVSHPCQNGGRCVDGVNSYTCKCLAGCNGTLCEYVVPPTEDAVPIFSGPHYVYNAAFNRRGPCTEYHFTCHVNYTSPSVDDGARFDVALLFDGQRSTTFKTATSQELDVSFTHPDLKGYFGTTVSCSVRSYWAHAPSVRSNFTSSVYSYFVGIIYWTSNRNSKSVQMNESAVAMPIYFQPTLPVACSQCAVSLPLSRHTGLTVSSCSVTFSSSDPPDTVRSISVRAVQTPGTNSRVAVIKFGNVTTECEDTAWNGYRPNDVPVLIIDEELAVSCISDGDPHIRTFDSAYYSVYFEGDFLLWKSITTSNVEVHARFQNCLMGNVSCNCAVAFREDNNIVGVYACDSQQAPIVIQYLRDPNTTEPRVQIGDSGLYFYITMPSGRAMSVSTACVDCGRLTITLYSISEDLTGHSEGLCGNYNNNTNDDRIPKGGTASENVEEPIQFATSYMIPKNESFINGHIYYPKCMLTTTKLPSECQCGQPDSINCDGVNAAANALVPGVMFTTYGTDGCLQGHSRQKRDTGSTASQGNVITPSDNTPNDVADPPKSPLHAGAIGNGKGKDACEAPLNRSTAYKDCAPYLSSEVKATILNSCGTDVQLTGDVETVIDGILSKHNEACRRSIQELDKRRADEANQQFNETVTAVERTGGATVSGGNPIASPATAEALSSVDLCEGQPVCSGNGTCSNSTCICFPGWIGEQCSIPEGVVPEIIEPIRGPSFCDVRDIASRPDNCTVVSLNVGIDTFRTSVVGRSATADTVYYVTPSIVTAMRLRVILPLSPLLDNSTSPNYTWTVALSNDNVTYGRQLNFLVFDSKCMDCSNETKRCRHKNDTCVIGGKCYSNEEKKDTSSRKCYGCVPQVSNSTWTIGWVGLSCLQPISKPPLLTHLKLASFCNFSDTASHCERVACDVRVYGPDCMSPNLSMSAESQSLPDVPVVVRCIGFVGVYYQLAYVVTNNAAQFSFPVSPLDPTSVSPYYTWNVSVSNDNQTFSDDIVITVFDSDCIECSSLSGECRQKPETCLVDGKCYKRDAKDDRCLGCLPEISNSSLTIGWIAPGCAQRLNIPPFVTRVKFESFVCNGVDCATGVCDARVLNCSTVVFELAISTFWSKSTVKCIYGATIFYPSPAVLTAMKLRFELPVSPLNHESSSPYYTWTVSLSNDNDTFGDSFHFLVYDSKCVQCNHSAGTCRQKQGSCIIDGRCYSNNELNPSNSSYKCITQVSTSAWTRDVEECARNPCLNGGNCTRDLYPYSCICAAAFAGVNCETNITSITTSSTLLITTTVQRQQTTIGSTPSATTQRLTTTEMSPVWGLWSPWSPCTTRCDINRISNRTRTCQIGTCPGVSDETLNCLMTNCPEEQGVGSTLITSGRNATEFDNKTFLSNLFESSVNAVNKYCNMDTQTCCAQLLNGISGAAVNPASGFLEVATLSGVKIANGYPKPIGVGRASVRLLFTTIFRRLSSQCAAAMRSMREVTDDNAVVNLNADLVVAALEGDKANISQATGLKIESVTNEQATTTVLTTATTKGPSIDKPTIIIIATVSAAVAVGLLITVCVVLMRKTRNKPSPSRLSEDKEPPRQPAHAEQRRPDWQPANYYPGYYPYPSRFGITPYPARRYYAYRPSYYLNS